MYAEIIFKVIFKFYFVKFADPSTFIIEVRERAKLLQTVVVSVYFLTGCSNH